MGNLGPIPRSLIRTLFYPFAPTRDIHQTCRIGDSIGASSSSGKSFIERRRHLRTTAYSFPFRFREEVSISAIRKTSSFAEHFVNDEAREPLPREPFETEKRIGLT